MNKPQTTAEGVQNLLRDAIAERDTLKQERDEALALVKEMQKACGKVLEAKNTKYEWGSAEWRRVFLGAALSVQLVYDRAEALIEEDSNDNA